MCARDDLMSPCRESNSAKTSTAGESTVSKLVQTCSYEIFMNSSSWARKKTAPHSPELPQAAQAHA